MTKIRKQVLTFALVFTLVFSNFLGVVTVYADTQTINDTDITVNADTTITGTSNGGAVIINGDCTVTLSDLEIDVSKKAKRLSK